MLIIHRLPTSSGEKVTLGLTCFVAFSVFMLMVAEKVPATSDTVPIIGKRRFFSSQPHTYLCFLSLGIYLTIVMSLTVSERIKMIGTRGKVCCCSLVDIGHHGGDCRQSLPTSSDVHKCKTSCAIMVS